MKYEANQTLGRGACHNGRINMLFSEIKKNPPRRVDARLIELLDRINNFCGGKVFIHRMFDSAAATTSQHYYGRAADFHIRGMHVLDQYALVERFYPPGLGIYGKDVWTITPGLHVDVRDTEFGRRWAYIMDKTTNKRKMVAIGKDFFTHILKLED